MSASKFNCEVIILPKRYGKIEMGFDSAKKITAVKASSSKVDVSKLIGKDITFAIESIVNNL